MDENGISLCSWLDGTKRLELHHQAIFHNFRPIDCTNFLIFSKILNQRRFQEVSDLSSNFMIPLTPIETIEHPPTNTLSPPYTPSSSHSSPSSPHLLLSPKYAIYPFIPSNHYLYRDFAPFRAFRRRENVNYSEIKRRPKKVWIRDEIENEHTCYFSRMTSNVSFSRRFQGKERIVKWIFVKENGIQLENHKGNESIPMLVSMLIRYKAFPNFDHKCQIKNCRIQREVNSVRVSMKFREKLIRWFFEKEMTSLLLLLKTMERKLLEWQE